jgi:septal ring factor EnvC (AmiA/AmiB activator)
MSATVGEAVCYRTWGKGRMMNEETFQRKLAELVAEIGTLPASEREKLETLAEETKERHRQLKETVSSLQESIDFLRLSIKYMLFYLEATRRENNYLRKMLEDNSDNSSQ